MAKKSRESLHSLVFGGKEIAHYFSQLSYGCESKIEHVGRTTFNDISSIAQGKNTDIALVDADKVFAQFLLSKNYLVLPYVDFVLDISGSFEQIVSRMNRNRRRIFQRIEELNYSYENTQDLEKGRFFYHNMYLPHVRERYAESARPLSFGDFEKHLRKGGLMLVKLESEYVSGILHMRDGDELRALVLGVSGIQEHVADGAASAPLHFLISWAKQKGFKRIDYGSTYPFLRDGVFLFKKSWGMQVRPLKERHARVLAIKFGNLASAKEFLLENPLIFCDSNRLIGLVFSDSNIKEVGREYCLSGLSELIVYSSRTEPANISLGDGEFQFPESLDAFTRMASREGLQPYYLHFSEDEASHEFLRK